MKKIVYIISVLLLISYPCVYAQQSSDNVPRKKVAVVLSGGGAKGSAHIGALKVLEKAGIPVDMVVGTSMGALMGGLYSIGYSADMLDSLVRMQDWEFLLSDKIPPGEQTLMQRNKQGTYMLSFTMNDIGKFSFARPGFIKGKNLSNLFSKLTLGYHDSLDFNTLPIPFACVATDMVHFREVDFHKGNLATAMRASMSIPAVFSPVFLDSLVLVDGGLVNNFPVDVAKQMGADIVIGVTVQNIKEKAREDFTSIGAVMNQLMDINTERKFLENLLQTDIFIRVNVDGYSAASFNSVAIDTLISRGEQAALDKWEELLELKESLNLRQENARTQSRNYYLAGQNVRMKISDVSFKNVTREDAEYLRRKFNLEQGSTITMNEIEKVIATIRSNLFYNDASYQIHYRKDGYGIDIVTEGKKAAELYMGVRFDNEEKVSLQFNGVMPMFFMIPMTTEATLRLGKRSMARLETTFNPYSFASITAAYTYRHNDINVYYKGDRDFNPDYRQHQFDLGVMNYGVKNFLFDAFARWDYYDYKTLLSDRRARTSYVSTSHLYSYHAKIHFDNRLNKYFADRGEQYEVQYALYTDNFYSYDDHIPLSEVSFRFRRILPLTDALVFEPMLYGRGIFGQDVPTVLRNCAGGHYFSLYIEQQMPLAGLGNAEMFDNMFAALQISFRYRLSTHNYLSFTCAGAQSADKIGHFFDNDCIFGARLSYSFSSIIGPVGASLGYSNRTKSPYLFVNIGYEF